MVTGKAKIHEVLYDTKSHNYRNQKITARCSEFQKTEYLENTYENTYAILPVPMKIHIMYWQNSINHKFTTQNVTF